MLLFKFAISGYKFCLALITGLAIAGLGQKKPVWGDAILTWNNLWGKQTYIRKLSLFSGNCRTGQYWTLFDIPYICLFRSPAVRASPGLFDKTRSPARRVSPVQSPGLIDQARTSPCPSPMRRQSPSPSPLNRRDYSLSPTKDNFENGKVLNHGYCIVVFYLF